MRFLCWILVTIYLPFLLSAVKSCRKEAAGSTETFILTFLLCNSCIRFRERRLLKSVSSLSRLMNLRKKLLASVWTTEIYISIRDFYISHSATWEYCYSIKDIFCRKSKLSNLKFTSHSRRGKSFLRIRLLASNEHTCVSTLSPVGEGRSGGGKNSV